MRAITETGQADARRYRVRYRDGGVETSQTFSRHADAVTFRDILGDGKGTRVADAHEWLEARRKGEAADDMSFGRWFDHYVDQLTGITPRTRNDYRSIHRRYLAHLDRLPLAGITRTHVTSLVNDMDEAGRSPKTIKQAVYLLSTCLQLAIDERRMTSNPCKRVRLPQQSLATQEPRYLTPEEAAMLIAATPPHYQPLVMFLFGTGMRWSEATAIEARHVDLDAGTVRVEQAWKRVPGQGLILGPPKSKKSRRTVNAGVPALVAVKPLLRKSRDLVFVTPSGGMISHANFYNNVWRPACARAGLDPAPRLHDTRHSHASWLLSDGQDISAVQDQLGHESIETTRKVYAHLMPAVGVAVGRAASAAMQRVFEAQALRGVMPRLDASAPALLGERSEP